MMTPFTDKFDDQCEHGPVGPLPQPLHDIQTAAIALWLQSVRPAGRVAELGRRRNFMRRVTVILAAPMIAVAALCVWSRFACAGFTVGMPPYRYDIESTRDSLVL